MFEEYREPDVMLDYFGGTSGTYAGFDRCDRGNLNQRKTDLTGTPVREEVDCVDEKGSSPQATPP